MADADRYRYSLWVAVGAGPTLAVILKNPSTADTTRLDPTVGKVEAWARRQDYGTVCYVNLFARRSTIPQALNAFPYAAMIGLHNDGAIVEAICSADAVIAAWGNPNGISEVLYRQRITEVLSLVQQATTVSLSIVGAPTEKGFPRHGLHWNGAAQLFPYSVLNSS
jgi:hypothetical protein